MSDPNQNLPMIHALWIGDTLGKLSAACLSSFVQQGHRVCLHAYTPISDVPSGINICDANLIIPKEKIIKHKATGSYALFSDIFRYELLNQTNHGIYVDCDVYCLKPITMPNHGYLLGYEDDTKINGAILALPKDSELLHALLKSAYDPYFVPPWYKSRKQKILKIRKQFGFSRHVANMPRGVIGPDAITYYAQHYQITHFAQSIDVFYPIHHHCIGHLLNSRLSIKDIITPDTLCIHLYQERLRHLDLSCLPQNCILDKMINSH